MKSLNSVQLIGHVGRNVETGETANQAKYVRFSMATNGTKNSDPDWHTVTSWNGTVELVEKLVKPGSKIYIQGELKTRSWENKNTGERMYRTEVLMRDFILLTSNGSKNPPAEADVPM